MENEIPVGVQYPGTVAKNECYYGVGNMPYIKPKPKPTR